MKNLVTSENIKSEIDLISHLIVRIKEKNIEVQGLQQAERILTKLEYFDAIEENKEELYMRLGKLYQGLYTNYMQVYQAQKASDPRRMDYLEEMIEL